MGSHGEVEIGARVHRCIEERQRIGRGLRARDGCVRIDHPGADFHAENPRGVELHGRFDAFALEAMDLESEHVVAHHGGTQAEHDVEHGELAGAALEVAGRELVEDVGHVDPHDPLGVEIPDQSA